MDKQIRKYCFSTASEVCQQIKHLSHRGDGNNTSDIASDRDNPFRGQKEDHHHILFGEYRVRSSWIFKSLRSVNIIKTRFRPTHQSHPRGWPAGYTSCKAKGNHRGWHRHGAYAYARILLLNDCGRVHYQEKWFTRGGSAVYFFSTSEELPPSGSLYTISPIAVTVTFF